MKNHFKIAIIGGGNGGQAMAGHFGLLGHDICLYNRTFSRVAHIAKQGGVYLTEAIQGFGQVSKVTDNLKEAISGAEIIMITTTADAHAEMARRMLPYLEDGQTIVLNPGRTCGAIEFSYIFKKYRLKKQVRLAEAQSLIYACRVEESGESRVIGIKDKVLLAAMPAAHTDIIVGTLNSIYNCFIPVDHVLITSLENIGAVFHPTVVLFNAATIERDQNFLLYNDMTPQIAAFIQKIDAERLAIGQAYGLNLVPAVEWISLAYPNVSGKSLCDKMRNNPAYYKIHAPRKLDSRLFTEDIPTGFLPMTELAKLAGVETPLMRSVIDMSQALLNRDFRLRGRTLDNLGLRGKSKEDLLSMLTHEEA